MPTMPKPTDAAEYVLDAAQRATLFLDVMRQRAEQYAEQAEGIAPHVLNFRAELVCDGRTLPRPVNYILARILPEEGAAPDPQMRPFVVVDPRAGHGPGIGGFKADSEIGVAMKAGHPCYFVGFLPEAVPGQTIPDVIAAEAVFLEKVIALHPEAEGRPCVIGNCQAGWSVMMLAALRPELFGPVIVAGTPLSYWAGVTGQYPMRYSGGLLGGSWLTALAGDLGAGTFDGAWLVQNFENQNPANTLWTKQYNLYSKIDTEAERYLGFEKWWGGHVTLNAEEMQFIVDDLFVGNKLAAGEIRDDAGTVIDLRNIRSPIVVFCSKGDNITPPAQALDWILDLYESEDEIRRYGQTIVYTVHDTVGHLGIFVSSGVARKEHDEFASNIDLIDVLPPGLYEAVLTPRDEETHRPELVGGDWRLRLEPRGLDDIRALGCNDLEDERRFAAAARVSEINLALYRTFAQPAVRAMVSEPVARTMRELHPLRLQYGMFGRSNPFMAWITGAAAQVRTNRRPAAPDNPFLALQEQMSRQIVRGLDDWRKSVEKLSEETFRQIYGSPVLQAALGIERGSNRRPKAAPRSLLHRLLVEERMKELRADFSAGGIDAAVIRSLLHVSRAIGSADERAFEVIRRLRKAQKARDRLPLDQFKLLVRRQNYMLEIDEEAAMAAVPGLLPDRPEVRRAALEVIREIVAARGTLTAEAGHRLRRVEAIFAPTTPELSGPAADQPAREPSKVKAVTK
ncbi:DUF3141 domain-containing protein [Cereibacter sphaeroides]|uniref:DUF3141 domain-containing protein n=1 Tax=Cereibacter sphaeroides TaxID=1063 RepID=UPI001F3A3D90|nr:DUF3141 domain-containing protein [Cereibacter sphaeroides]MCE6951361.1 DUF3141 domain-containing protein [Cereibacter sphaeroides]